MAFVQEVEVQRTYSAPIDVVWNVYTDHAGWHRWAGFPSSWIETPGETDRNGRGAVRGFGANGVSVLEEVLDFEPPKRMTYRMVRGGLPVKNHRGEVVFEPEDGGTRVVWRCRFDSKVPGLGPLMRYVVTRVFRGALEGLAQYGLHEPKAPRKATD
jgi:uncharacterized protein YndB with AHSA1/START domain